MADKDVFLLEQIVEYCDRIDDSFKVFGDSFEEFDQNVHFQDDIPPLRDFCAQYI